ncbi:MAG: hypothetical protein E7423_05270 [Ruminococcaceae bacterium]|nr:hypothetical protein [Oscillospiraceae bacterium]
MPIPQQTQTIVIERLTEMACDPQGRKELIRIVQDTRDANTGRYKSTDPSKAYILSSPTHPEYNGRQIVEIAVGHNKSSAAVAADTMADNVMHTVGKRVDIIGQEDAAAACTIPGSCLLSTARCCCQARLHIHVSAALSRGSSVVCAFAATC